MNEKMPFSFKFVRPISIVRNDVYWRVVSHS
jgi:hypothetical protein